MQPKFCIVTKTLDVPVFKDETGMMGRHVIDSVGDSFDPFLLLDHIGPINCGPQEAVGAPDHPHRGLQVLSYVLSGGIEYCDTLGNEGVIKEGGVQLLSCGKGLVHYEMPTKEVFTHGGVMEGFQLWINMANSRKMNDPSCETIPACDLPLVRTEDNGAEIHVLCGEAFGVPGALECDSHVLLLHIHLTSSTFTTLTMDPLHSSVLLYVWSSGGLLVCREEGVETGATPVNSGQCAILSSGERITLKPQGSTDCHCLLLAGKPLNETVVKYGPFAMSTRSEIDQAIQDYKSGALGCLAGEDERLQQNKEALVRHRLKYQEHVATSTGDFTN